MIVTVYIGRGTRAIAGGELGPGLLTVIENNLKLGKKVRIEKGNPK